MGWIEIVRRSVQFLDLGNSKANRDLVNCFSQATGILSSDSFIESNRDSDSDPLFRVFRSDQRAIGEIMIDADSNGGAACIGYASFCARLEGDQAFSQWLTHLSFSVDELAQSEQPHPRLVALQHNLIDLIVILDPSGIRSPGRHRTKLKVSPLTSVEIELIATAGAPQSLNAIAERLGITRASVEYRLQTLMQKLGAQSASEALAKGREEGWL